VTHDRTIVIGAGIGGLVAATVLAARGEEVLIVERQRTPGGKMRLVEAGGAAINAGPTVFTMRDIFEAIFAEAGTSLSAELAIEPLAVLARHSWGNGPELDLYADLNQSVDAIGRFAGADEAKRFVALNAEARRMFETLKKPFIEAQRPSPLGVAFGGGAAGLMRMLRINPFETLWSAVSRHMKDPRLQQLFGRYATYCGSSPFSAVATLLLIAHVEQDGVWTVEGGMHGVARAFERVFTRLGGVIRYNTAVSRIETQQGRVSAVITEEGERLSCRATIVNGDVNAVATGLFGDDIKHAVAPTPRNARSLSAITWCATLETSGFPLALHNVFFSSDYAHEFEELKHGYPSEPTVYLCAQNRPADPSQRDALFILVNAPADGDETLRDHHAVEHAMLKKLKDCGLSLAWTPESVTPTTPADFARLFPATGGALYGRASHGWLASFQRPGAKTVIPGLYLAGGSTHPGPGVPMAAMSGRLAAEALLASKISAPRSRPMAIAGGIATR